MKSASARFGVGPAGLAICWRSVWRRVELGRSRLVGVQLDVVVRRRVRRPEADDGRSAVSSRSSTTRWSSALRVVEQVARGLAHRRVVEDLRVVAGAAPRSRRTASSRCARRAPRAGVVERPGAEERRRRRLVDAADQSIGRRLRARLGDGCRALSLARRALALAADLAYSSRVRADERVARARGRAARARRRPRATRRATWTTGPEYAARSAPPCAPATSSRRRSAAAASKPSRSISAATARISSSDGVISPDRPIRSASSLARRLEDPRPGHHHAEVDDLVVVAAEHDADDVLADVVDVALDGGHHDRARADRDAARRVAASPPRCTGRGGRRPAS